MAASCLTGVGNRPAESFRIRGNFPRFDHEAGGKRQTHRWKLTENRQILSGSIPGWRRNRIHRPPAKTRARGIFRRDFGAHCGPGEAIPARNRTVFGAVRFASPLRSWLDRASSVLPGNAPWNDRRIPGGISGLRVSTVGATPTVSNSARRRRMKFHHPFERLHFQVLSRAGLDSVDPPHPFLASLSVTEES